MSQNHPNFVSGKNSFPGKVASFPQLFRSLCSIQFFGSQLNSFIQSVFQPQNEFTFWEVTT